ncbi:MAG: hypothetical protein LBJ25_07785 [Candidatus Margulisbacteria bacterium]|jgi:hypothetical protein|nr:hypothetical protein [Candidatus Margulisiibacteriota bacterium]
MNKFYFLLLGVVLTIGAAAQPAAVSASAQPAAVSGNAQPTAVSDNALDLAARLEAVSSDILAVTYTGLEEKKDTNIFHDLSLGLKPLRLRADFKRLDYRPELTVAYQARLSWFDAPIYYAPALIFDNRPNAFSIPAPLPEFGNNIFNGVYWRWNINYFWQDNLYGNLYFGRAAEKGAGYGFQQIVRFSDASQMTYRNQNWQYWPTQEEFSWEYSFLEIPSFNAKYADRIRNEFNSLRATRINYEEYNGDLLMREFELSYSGNFKLNWQKISLYTNNIYASLKELTSAQAGYRWASLSELYRDYEMPYLEEFRPGVGYDTVKYSLSPYSWHRIYGYLEGRKKFWIWTGDWRVTDYIDQRGGSPFNYDSEENYDDNVRTTVLLNLWGFDLGQTTQYSIYRGNIHTLIYFLRLRTKTWLIDFRYNLLKEELGVSGQMISF